MIMHRWNGISTRWKTSASTCTNIRQKNSFMRQLRNLHMSIITMCALTDITDTGHHMRQELRNGCYSRQRDWIAWAPKIGADGFRQGQSRFSGAKHPWWNLADSIESRQQSKIFLATSVTKMLDHNTITKGFYRLFLFRGVSYITSGYERIQVLFRWFFRFV